MKRPAFTLIELLVVISIIALLIGILLPALGGARDVARTLKCMTQVRSIAQATVNYASDHEDWLPPVWVRAGIEGYPNEDVFSNIFVRMGYMTAPEGIDNQSPFRCPLGTNERVVGWVPLGDQPHTTPTHFQYNYPGASDPTDSDPQLIDGVAVPTWYMLPGGNHNNWSFQDIRQQSHWERTKRMSNADYTSERTMAAELSNLNAGSPNYGQGRIAGRHPPYSNDDRDGGSNMAFFDGHAETIRTDNWYAGGDVRPVRFLWVD
ncbi:MAG: prepilin-type N-terminal cleavage/methylation domain-containing protein [Phycisphaeraceae bacterium]|nr:prepilin-type N-terminal cleavage/methylation domain-containing protein [Phycisphaeraceae bacterium]